MRDSRRYHIGTDHDVHTPDAPRFYGLNRDTAAARHRLQQCDHTGGGPAPKRDIHTDVEGRRGVCARIAFRVTALINTFY